MAETMRTRGSVNSEKFTPHARSDTSSEEGDRRKRTGSAGVELPNLADSRNQGILKDLGKGGPGHLLFPTSARTSRKVCTGKFVPAPEAKRRSASLQSQAKKMDNDLREVMGLGKSVESERKITKTIRSEYLSRAFALDLNDISLGARLSFAKGSVTDRAKISTTHHESSLLNLPKWETGPQFEGLLSVVSRGDVALTARGRLEGGIKSKANGVRVDPSNKSRGVLDERKHPLAEPSPTKVAALRQVMLRSMGNKEQSGSDSTSMATNISSSHRSFGMCVDWRTGSAEGARVEIEAGTFSISGRRGSLLSRVPKAFKGGRSFPLGRGGTDHRQMLGIPSTTNSPVVVAAREALRLRFRTSIEAFAFMRSVEDVDRPDSDWTEPLNSDAVSKGFRILHIRVDVSQLFQQIGRDEYRLYPPTTSFLLATPLSTVRTRIFTGSDRSMNNGFVVTLESWNQHMAWHPPLLQPCRAIVQARAILSEIRATAIRASAAANAVKSLTVPTGPRALQDTLTFIHANRELFQVFSAPISTFNHLEDGRPKTAPFEELRLSYRDMEALYRQVNILPGWMTSIGLLSIYNQVRSLDLPREIKQSAVPREIKQNVEGISFEQHQQCVVLMAKRLRIKMGDNVKGLPEYSFNPDRLPSPLDDNKIKESRIRPVDVHIVRAFARIFRAIADQELYHNFCDQEPLPTRPAENEEASISRNENICLSVSKTRVMRLSRFIDLLRSLGIVNSAGTLDSVKSLTRLSFREVKEIFANVVGLSSTSFNVTSSPEQEQPSQLAKNGPGLIFDSFVDAMRLIAAKIDASAAPYMFPVSRLSGSTYPSFTGSSMLGAILSIYRDSSSLLCSLSMKELLTLVEFMKHKRLKSGYVLCSQNHLATETPIVISGSLKQEVSDDGHSKIEYLHRGSWCEVHFLLTSRHKYISTLTAQSDVELALISSEAFEAFCNRIDWMHARRQTETDAETLKERLFMHRSSCADILKEDVANEGNSPSAINGWECGSPTSPGCTITSQKGAPLALEQGMNNVDLREDLNDDELHQMHGELLKQDRVMKGEKVEGVDRPKTAVMRSDYAQQLHELGCYYFELRHISAARRLLCEACRIRMELFGAHDSCTLSSVRVLEQVDKWAYRQVDETTRAKVIERFVKGPISGLRGVPQTQVQIEMDMREFLRSHDTSRKASHADARADEDEVKKCGLKFLSVPTVDEAPVPRHLVQKYSNLESNRKEWLESMQDNVNLLVTERTKRLALARAKFMGDRTIATLLSTVPVLTTNQWHFRCLSTGMRKVLSSQEVRGLHMGVYTILDKVSDHVGQMVSQLMDDNGMEAVLKHSEVPFSQMSAQRKEQAQLLHDLNFGRRMITVITIVDYQAQELRQRAGISWMEAYESASSVRSGACVMLQTNIRTLLANRRMFLVRRASLIRQNYRCHFARKVVKERRMSDPRFWLRRRRMVTGKGSEAEWNDRHALVKRTATQAMERLETFDSRSSDGNSTTLQDSTGHIETQTADEQLRRDAENEANRVVIVGVDDVSNMGSSRMYAEESFESSSSSSSVLIDT